MLIQILFIAPLAGMHFLFIKLMYKKVIGISVHTIDTVFPILHLQKYILADGIRDLAP